MANFLLLQTGERLSPINIVFTKFIYYISSLGAYLLTKKEIKMHCAGDDRNNTLSDSELTQ